MIPPRIKEAIESNPELNEVLLTNGFGQNWKKFNRSVFEFIARRINKKITQHATTTPSLITEKVILGKDQLQTILFSGKFVNEDSFIDHLTNLKRTFNWVSSKTLHSYWNGGKAKNTKLNSLLVFLEIESAEWDEWKKIQPTAIFKSGPNRAIRRSGPQDLLRNYYLGSYYLYYQKSDNSTALIKAPFIIGLDIRSQIYAETLTEGHPYRSSLIEIRDGILYIHCENQLFDEKENHIFNVGNETSPEVLFGISNTISVKTKLAIGIRNVLVKQQKNFNEETFLEKEIPFSTENNLNTEEKVVLKYFNQHTANLINSRYCCSLEALKNKMNI